MHSYLYWLAKPGRLAKLEVQEKSALWTQFFPVDTEVHNRHGLMLVLPDLEHMEGALDQRLPELEALGGGAVPLNFLHVVVGRDAFPAVTDRTLFYNTDAELKKVLQQSQEVFAKKAELLTLFCTIWFAFQRPQQLPPLKGFWRHKCGTKETCGCWRDLLGAATATSPSTIRQIHVGRDGRMV